MSKALQTAKLLNSKLIRRSSLLEVFLLITAGVSQSFVATDPFCDRNMVVHHPLLAQVKETYTNFAFQHCLRQYMLSHVHSVVYDSAGEAWID